MDPKRYRKAAIIVLQTYRPLTITTALSSQRLYVIIARSLRKLHVTTVLSYRRLYGITVLSYRRNYFRNALSFRWPHGIIAPSYRNPTLITELSHQQLYYMCATFSGAFVLISFHHLLFWCRTRKKFVQMYWIYFRNIVRNPSHPLFIFYI